MGFKVVLLIASLWNIGLVKNLAAAQCFGAEQAGNIQLTENFQYVLYERQLEFSLNLFHQLYKKNSLQNLFFSPASIHQALMLSFFGSAGETEAQLRKALELKDDASKTDLLRQFKMENYFMEAKGINATGYELSLLNKIFVSFEEPIRQCVTELLSGEIERLNFANQSEASRLAINAWVESNTNFKIRDLIPQGVVTPASRLVLVNSAYFRGNWAQQFKKSNTKVSLFYISPKEVVYTQMMNLKSSFRHGVSEELRAYILELPYEGETISMYILLPPFTPNAIEETISRLNATTLREAIDPNSLIEEKLEVALPKFKIEKTLELNKALESIGIIDLFDSEKSDLSELTENPGGLGISTAIHKSFLEVNEEGSEAAASTFLIDTRSGRPLDQTRFICNHPFVFMIYDNSSNRILFLGTFRNPKKTI